MKLTTTPTFILLLGMALTASCSHAPEKQTFVLPNPRPIQSGANNHIPIQVQEIKLADYLNQGGFVIKNGDVQITITQQNKWGEPLDKGIERYLNRSFINNTSIDTESGTEGIPVQTRSVNIVFDAFESNGFETVIASGSWYAYNTDERTPIVAGNFHFESPAQPQNYTGIVKGYATLLERLVADIHQQLVR